MTFLGLDEEQKRLVHRIRRLASETHSTKEHNNVLSMACERQPEPFYRTEPQVNKKNLQSLVLRLLFARICWNEIHSFSTLNQTRIVLKAL